MLNRLQESFRQQRDFTSDAAHELKTSVAVVKSSLQSLLQRPRPEEEYRTGLERLLEDCGRLEDLLARMLRLARIEQWVESGASSPSLGTTGADLHLRGGDFCACRAWRRNATSRSNSLIPRPYDLARGSRRSGIDLGEPA